jgi:hypothetical protein
MLPLSGMAYIYIYTKIYEDIDNRHSRNIKVPLQKFEGL